MRPWANALLGTCLAVLFGCSSTSTNEGSGGAGSGGSAGSGGGGAASAGQRLFVTSTALYIDQFGPGLAGADQTCTSAAKGGSMTGIWMAVLSDATQSAQQRLTVKGPVVNTNGETLAKDATDLWDGSLAAPVRYDENGEFAGGAAVWSATNADGSSAIGDACGGWADQGECGGARRLGDRERLEVDLRCAEALLRPGGAVLPGAVGPAQPFRGARSPVSANRRSPGRPSASARRCRICAARP